MREFESPYDKDVVRTIAVVKGEMRLDANKKPLSMFGVFSTDDIRQGEVVCAWTGIQVPVKRFDVPGKYKNYFDLMYYGLQFDDIFACVKLDPSGRPLPWDRSNVETNIALFLNEPAPEYVARLDEDGRVHRYKEQGSTNLCLTVHRQTSPKLALPIFQATRDIKRGEELTWYYGESYDRTYDLPEDNPKGISKPCTTKSLIHFKHGLNQVSSSLNDFLFVATGNATAKDLREMERRTEEYWTRVEKKPKKTLRRKSIRWVLPETEYEQKSEALYKVLKNAVVTTKQAICQPIYKETWRGKVRAHICNVLTSPSELRPFAMPDMEFTESEKNVKLIYLLKTQIAFVQSLTGISEAPTKKSAIKGIHGEDYYIVRFEANVNAPRFLEALKIFKEHLYALISDDTTASHPGSSLPLGTASLLPVASHSPADRGDKRIDWVDARIIAKRRRDSSEVDGEQGVSRQRFEYLVQRGPETPTWEHEADVESSLKQNFGSLKTKLTLPSSSSVQRDTRDEAAYEATLSDLEKATRSWRDARQSWKDATEHWKHAINDFKVAISNTSDLVKEADGRTKRLKREVKNLLVARSDNSHDRHIKALWDEYKNEARQLQERKDELLQLRAQYNGMKAEMKKRLHVHVS